jgi:hypothetical protein
MSAAFLHDRGDPDAMGASPALLRRAMIPGPAKRSTLSECSVPEHRGFDPAELAIAFDQRGVLFASLDPRSEPAIADGRFPNAVWQRS